MPGLGIDESLFKSTPEDYKKHLVVGEPATKKLPFVDREEQIAEIMKKFETQWIELAGNLPGESADKSINPLIGFHAVPGGGKSYLIDELVSFDCQKAANGILVGN